MAKTIYPVEGPLAQSGTYSGKVAFSRGVKIDPGTLLFVSGALAMDAGRNIVGVGDMGTQTRQVLRNIQAVLREAGATFRDVVKVTVFTKDITQFRAIHDARLEFFEEGHLPASTMVQVSGFVHPDALIEIEAYAVLPGPRPAARRAAARSAGRAAARRSGARTTARTTSRKAGGHPAARRSATRRAIRPARRGR
ncbi:MAG TPA: RidA family protein [bacterium]|nr:RidA family protein [bacterium]